MKEWDRKDEQKQTETASQEGDPIASSTNQPQDAPKKGSAVPLQEPQPPSEHGNPEESQVLFSYHPHRIDKFSHRCNPTSIYLYLFILFI